MDFAGVDLNELEIENIGNWPFFIRVIIIIAIFILTLFMGYMFDLSDEWDVLTNSQNKRIELENTFENCSLVTLSIIQPSKSVFGAQY